MNIARYALSGAPVRRENSSATVGCSTIVLDDITMAALSGASPHYDVAHGHDCDCRRRHSRSILGRGGPVAEHSTVNPRLEIRRPNLWPPPSFTKAAGQLPGVSKRTADAMRRRATGEQQFYQTYFQMPGVAQGVGFNAPSFEVLEQMAGGLKLPVVALFDFRKEPAKAHG